MWWWEQEGIDLKGEMEMVVVATEVDRDGMEKGQVKIGILLGWDRGREYNTANIINRDRVWCLFGFCACFGSSPPYYVHSIRTQRPVKKKEISQLALRKYGRFLFSFLKRGHFSSALNKAFTWRPAQVGQEQRNWP